MLAGVWVGGAWRAGVVGWVAARRLIRALVGVLSGVGFAPDFVDGILAHRRGASSLDPREVR